MFNLREFIKKGLIKAVGKMPAHWVMLNAAGWHEKGVLFEEDLAEIEGLMKEPSKVTKEELLQELTEE